MDRDRFRGAVLGLAVGDALGTTVEFKAPGTFPPVTDMVGGGPFGLPAGAGTDDTSMALCLAESLVDVGGFDPADQLRLESVLLPRSPRRPSLLRSLRELFWRTTRSTLGRLRRLGLADGTRAEYSYLASLERRHLDRDYLHRPQLLVEKLHNGAQLGQDFVGEKNEPKVPPLEIARRRAPQLVGIHALAEPSLQLLAGGIAVLTLEFRPELARLEEAGIRRVIQHLRNHLAARTCVR